MGRRRLSRIHSPYYYYYLDMHHSEVVARTSIVVQKDWLTDSYSAWIELYSASDELLDSWTGTWGPLYEAAQVEAAVHRQASQMRVALLERA